MLLLRHELVVGCTASLSTYHAGTHGLFRAAALSEKSAVCWNLDSFEYISALTGPWIFDLLTVDTELSDSISLF